MRYIPIELAASRIHQRAEERRQEEMARQQRLAGWQAFRPTTRSMLSRVEALGGAVPFEALAEAILREEANVTSDLVVHRSHNESGADL